MATDGLLTKLKNEQINTALAILPSGLRDQVTSKVL